MSNTGNYLKKIIKKIPEKPGVYLFKNKKRQILYIGKSSKLKSRVSSYFTKPKDLSAFKQSMLPKIKNIDYILSDNELEALLLESNLIKKHKPRYNIILKDDKQYKFIKIDYTDDFPKIYTVRNIEKGPASYYGPFTDGYAVKKTLNLLNKLFPYRECNQNIFIDNSEELKRKKCLRYHINRCLAPCTGKVSKKEYNRLIRQCELFLQGKQEKILTEIKREMKNAAKKKDFEKAAFFRDQLSDLNKIIAEQKIISTKKINQDYISFFQSEKRIIINLFIVRDGKLLGKENYRLSLLKEDINEALASFIKQYYINQPFIPNQIIVQEKIKDEEMISRWLSQKSNKKVKFITPIIGKNKKLIDLGIKNAEEYDKIRRIIKPLVIKKQNIKSLKELQDIFKFKKIPKRIECYDISNIQGQAATGSMAVFISGLPKKSEYRRFRIKTVKGANDVAMIKEVLSRRFNNALSYQNIRPQDRWALPDLIIIDGGKGQLNSALSVLRENKLDIPILSLAKKFEEIYLKNIKNPKRLPKDSPSLRLLQQIRDESHRFAVSYHRKLKENEISSSVLDEIPGIGKEKKKKLLNKFKTIKGIIEADINALKKILGKKTSVKLLDKFAKKR